jgi:hypothetical protein
MPVYRYVVFGASVGRDWMYWDIVSLEEWSGREGHGFGAEGGVCREWFGIEEKM